VVIVGLSTSTDAVPPSLPIGEAASMGVAIFDPFPTITDSTSGSAVDMVNVIVCPVPTDAFLAYQTPVRKSAPAVVLVGSTAVTHIFPKLSDSVIVTPACADAATTITSPPVLSNAAVVCVSSAVGFRYSCDATTSVPAGPANAAKLPGAVGVGIAVACVLAVALIEYVPVLPLASFARTR
jgi:hypothetical protein